MDKIGLYIHWPYCARICPYCDFNIYKNKPDAETDLVAAMLSDMRYWREISGARNLVSIHFGGGTPSLLAARNMGKLISLAKQLWTPMDDLEIGLEANPKDINESALSTWRAAGIERLSIGVQSFDDSALQFLGRDHDGHMAKAALEMAVSIMPRVSADLIYGSVGQTPSLLAADIEIALASGVSHVSTYQLTIEQKTAFGQAEKRGVNKAVGADNSADLFEQTIATLKHAGFNQYEVSNFAKGHDTRSRHNLLYWQGGDYVGIGPGAHGRLTINAAHGRVTTDNVRTATIATLKPGGYMANVAEHGHGITERETLSPTSWAEEYLLMGMRISEGISLSRYEQISGHSLSSEKIAGYENAGLLTKDDDRLSATPKGRMVLDTLCHEILT